MNNEIGRKLTSLTLMTLMLAGGVVIGVPSMVPEAAAAGQLYVSAENAQFENNFGGAQIVEIIVKDPNRLKTNERVSEPTVLVDNTRVRMVQGSDGYWYAYIGDKTKVLAFDSYADGATVVGTHEESNRTLDFGSDIDPGLNSGSTAAGKIGDDLTVYAFNVFTKVPNGVITNEPTLSNWNGTRTNGFTTPYNYANTDHSSVLGQIGVNTTDWPFIQLYDLRQGTFDIVLEQAGADEIVILDYDTSGMDDYAGLTLDRNSAPKSANVHVSITDYALNIDPTNEDTVIFYSDIVGTASSAGMSWTNGSAIPSAANWANTDRTIAGFDDNGKLLINDNALSVATEVLVRDGTLDDVSGDQYFIFMETGDNTGVFSNTDDSDDSSIDVHASAKRGSTAIFDYNESPQSFTATNYVGTVDMDESSVGDEWNSGESLTVSLTDNDFNTNTLRKETFTIASDLVPTMIIGSPLTLGHKSATASTVDRATTSIDAFSKIANVTSAVGGAYTSTEMMIIPGYTFTEYFNATSSASYVYINYDVSELMTTNPSAIRLFDSNFDKIAKNNVAVSATSGLIRLNATSVDTAAIGATDLVKINFTTTTKAIAAGDQFFVDIFTFTNDTGSTDRLNNAIYRLYAKESGDNTGIFTGTVEFVMLNQLNSDTHTVFSNTVTADRNIKIIVHEDLTDEDAPRVNYLDLGADGISTQVADQVAAPTHTGVVSTDMPTYKIGDTVVVTLEDQDMNVDSDLIDVYITTGDDTVGNNGLDSLVTVTFDDMNWVDTTDSTCSASVAGELEITNNGITNGLQATGFTLVETAKDSGIFTGSFQVPSKFCDTSGGTTVGDDTVRSTTGKDLEINYLDYRDASGETIEVGSGSSVRANTGIISFDRTVYPVPFGNATYSVSTNDQRFNLHTSADNLNDGANENSLAEGKVALHIRITDADYNVSASGEDKLTNSERGNEGLVQVDVKRGSTSVTVANFGNVTLPIKETSPSSGVFEYDLLVDFNDGPTTNCPTSFLTGGCVLQGDIVIATYNDTSDSSGQQQSVTDSATFDLRNGVIQSDKSVYIIGSDMILTLIDPDLDLDNDGAQSYTLDLIEWDSDAVTSTLGAKGVSGVNADVDPEPSNLRETGDSTGIFQVVIEIPNTLNSNKLDRGEKIDLEYTDWGPAGASYVGQENEDIKLTVYTSNFGATVELDQKVYSWTDKVYITVVAPDHNMDSLLVDAIGEASTDPLKVSTRGNQLTTYKLIESGADTGIFIGEVTLKGFAFNADGDVSTGETSTGNEITGTASSLTTGSGPTSGNIAATNNDGLTISFEFSEDETVVGSALIRWNIAEVQWLEASYPASGTGVVRIIDADMNLNPEAVDNFKVDAWSDSDAGGIDLTVSETNEATGIFEGTVFFTVSDDSSGHRLRVAEGDTVTTEYEDNTLPEPYTTADELDITATSLIGTLVPPLERAPAANLRTVDAFGNSLNSVSVDQQVQITAELANGQDREQSFAYLVQIQDGNGVTVSLAWITGSLSAGQSFSPALSWIPTESGSYTATAFVWESVDNPTALSPPVSTTIVVQ